MPKRFDTRKALPEYPTSVKDMYRQHYYEALDLATTSITERFDQPGYRTYQHLEDMLVKGVMGKPGYIDMNHVADFYGSDIKKPVLSVRLETLRVYIRNNSITVIKLRDIVREINAMKPTARQLFSEVVIVVKLILVMPAINATSERSFSDPR